MNSPKKVHAMFYRTELGNDPVKTIVGEDIRYIEHQLKLSRPEVAHLRKASSVNERTIFEARHKINSEQYRTLFFISDDQMILVHFFHKKTQKIPKKEIDLAWRRMKKWFKGENL